jgi:hypothetical protein
VADRWLLIEVFGGEGHEEPTVIAVGQTPKRMVPLASVLGRGRYLDDVRALVARVALSREPVRTRSADGRRELVGDPLVSFAGWVHGVYVWTGIPGEEPPQRDLAGAWYFNLTTDKIGGSDDLLDLYGVAPEDRRPERVTAEAFARLITNADEAKALAMLVRSQPGLHSLHCCYRCGNSGSGRGCNPDARGDRRGHRCSRNHHPRHYAVSRGLGSHRGRHGLVGGPSGRSGDVHLLVPNSQRDNLCRTREAWPAEA